jgi:hypothetical protein
MMRQTFSRERAARVLPILLAAHTFALILLRTVINADDFNNWDLIPFLNANSTSSIWELLQRPEVHFLNPFSFPLYNTGPESVLSAVFFRALGNINLYWSNIIVLIFYDAIFLFLLYQLFKLIFPRHRQQSFSWLLVAMSPVLLTNASTSAFNMQAYCVLLLGIYGIELLREQRCKGLALVVLSFLLISQAYPISFFLPYYLLAWLAWSLGFQSLGCRDIREHKQIRQLLIHAVLGSTIVVGMAFGVNYLSKGIYFNKISPFDPYGSGSVLSSLGDLLMRLEFFIKQSFYPTIRLDDVAVGFAPYFIYVTVCVWLISVVVSGGVRIRGIPRFSKTGISTFGWGIFGIASIGLVTLGYLPGFLNPIVKSQRVLMGDLFLIIVIVVLFSQAIRRHYSLPTKQFLLFPLLLLMSDIYYLSYSTFIDHSYNHYPVFDFDLSDGRVRHDLIAASKVMKRQAEDEFAIRVADLEKQIRYHLDEDEGINKATIAKDKLEIAQTINPNTTGYPVWPFRGFLLLSLFSPQILSIAGFALSIYEVFIKPKN